MRISDWSSDVCSSDLPAAPVARLPMPSRDFNEQEAAEIRGAADAFALRRRHHDKAVHKSFRPAGEMAGAVYDALEQARVEAIGRRSMKGVAINLDAALEKTFRSAETTSEIPSLKPNPYA